MCLCLCFLGGVGGLPRRCLTFVLDDDDDDDEDGGGGGDIDGDLARLFLSLRSLLSLPGDLLDNLDDENTGDGDLRILGGDGVVSARFLYGDLDLLLLRGDLLRDLYLLVFNGGEFGEPRLDLSR